MQKIRLNIQYFASGTIAGSSTSSNCDLQIVWSSTKNDSANTSSVTATVQIKKSGSGSTTGTFSGNITIDGTAYSISKYDTWSWGSWHTVGSKTKTVSHNADGSKQIAISSKLTQTGTSMAGTYSGSATVTLDTINRASVLGDISNFNLTDTITIPITKYVSTFTDNLTIKLGSTTIRTISSITNGYSLTFTTAEQNTIKSLMSSPQAALTFTLTTLNGSTSVGTNTTSAVVTSLSMPVFRNVIKKANGHYQVAINGLVDTTNTSPLQIYDDDGNLFDSCNKNSAAYTTNYMELGYLKIANSQVAQWSYITLLISGVFYGVQHCSTNLVSIHTAQNIVAENHKIGGNNARTFYYWRDDTNNRLYLYVRVTGGNGFGFWGSTVLTKLYCNWVPTYIKNIAYSSSWTQIS